MFKELLLNNTEGSQRLCREKGLRSFSGEPDYRLHFWRLHVVQGCKTNHSGIWLTRRPWWQQCGSNGLHYSLQQWRSCGAGWILALGFQCSFPKHSPPPSPATPIVEPRQRGRKHWGTHQHHRLLDLVTLKPTTWTPNPRPVFHSISPTITCNTHLLPHLTEARVNVNAPMLEIDGALPHSAPHIGFSGLFLSIHAKLGLDSKVQHLMTVSVP